MEPLNFEKISFSIITYSENARSDAALAINKAKEFMIEEAENLILQATNNLLLAEQEHVVVIQQEAQGINHHLSILFVHAEDQMIMAQMMVAMAKEFVELYKLLNKHLVK